MKLNNVHKVRIKAGMTQADLAAKAGISRVALIDIENYRTNPHYRNKVKIAEALKVEIQELFNASEL